MTICDWILENSSMKYTIFLHVFNDISINAYNISLIILGISAMNSIQYYEICNVAVINITNYKCVIGTIF